jgi:DNA-binding response OmpR family regulator
MENQVAKQPMVLVIEQDPLMLTAMAAVLNSAGFRCLLARTHEVGMAATRNAQFDLIVASFEDDVLEVARNVSELRDHQLGENLPVIFIAPRLDQSWIEPLNKAGGVHCLTRPFEPERLIELAEEACTLPHLSFAKVAPPKAHFMHDWVRLS